MVHTTRVHASCPWPGSEDGRPVSTGSVYRDLMAHNGRIMSPFNPIHITTRHTMRNRSWWPKNRRIQLGVFKHRIRSVAPVYSLLRVHQPRLVPCGIGVVSFVHYYISRKS